VSITTEERKKKTGETLFSIHHSLSFLITPYFLLDARTLMLNNNLRKYSRDHSELNLLLFTYDTFVFIRKEKFTFSFFFFTLENEKKNIRTLTFYLKNKPMINACTYLR
jgi:hypothetical protein